MRQGHLDEAADIATELAVAIANSEQMHLGQTLDVGLQNVSVLVDFVWVVGMKAYPCGEGELPDAVLPFLLGQFLGGLLCLGLLKLVGLQLRWVLPSRA